MHELVQPVAHSVLNTCPYNALCLWITGFNRQTGKLTSKYSSSVVPISGIPLLSNNAVGGAAAPFCGVSSSSCPRCHVMTNIESQILWASQVNLVSATLCAWLSSRAALGIFSA